MHIKDKETQKQIRVINCEDITKNKDIIKNFNDFNELLSLIQLKSAEYMRKNLNTLGESTLIFNDGSFFRGNIINDYIICHKKDFSNLFFHRQKVKKYVINPIKNYFNYFRKDMIDKINFFKGVMRNGLKEGYCQVKYSD